MIQLYTERMQISLSEYMYVIILRCVVQKLCVAKNCLPPGLSFTVHFFEAENYHTKKTKKTKQSALHTNLVNMVSFFTMRVI